MPVYVWFADPEKVQVWPINDEHRFLAVPHIGEPGMVRLPFALFSTCNYETFGGVV